MKKILFIIFLAIFSITPVYAEGGRGGHGGGHGGGWGGAWIIPALIGSAIVYDMYQPRTVYVQPPYAPVYAPPAYVPGYVPSVASAPLQYWYFCAAANGYYPYVRSCPSGWQTVPAMPPTDLPAAR